MSIVYFNIPTYYVKNPLKIKKRAKDKASSGGATIYVTDDSMLFQYYRDFFNNFNTSNTYRIDREILLRYMDNVKFEYILNVVPKEDETYTGQVDLDYWNKKYSEIVDAEESYYHELSVEEHMMQNPERLSLRANDKGFTLLREVMIPNITQMAVKKDALHDGTFEYVFYPEIKNSFNIFSTSVDGTDENIEEFEMDSQVDGGINLIIYGAPGTGKSKELDKRYGEDCIRVNFHPEYTYYDFIGTHRPEPVYKVMEEEPAYKFYKADGSQLKNGEPYINYEFVPGPFSLILKEAFLKPNQMHTLIIEELNRANAPAVFGDVFQLLDRENDGTSTYTITNLELLRYLKSENCIDLERNEIYLPKNLNILATMNSADQGVFVMDSAFKRRWTFEYLPIEFAGISHENALVMYNNMELTWRNFAETINSKLSELGINEDKHLGPYFIKEYEISDRKVLASKILIYLWDDVARHKRKLLFIEDISTFADLNRKFLNNEEIFKFKFKDSNRDVSEALVEQENDNEQ